MNHYPPMNVFEDTARTKCLLSQSHTPANEENFDRTLTMQECFGFSCYQDWKQNNEQ